MWCHPGQCVVRKSQGVGSGKGYFLGSHNETRERCPLFLPDIVVSWGEDLRPGTVAAILSPRGDPFENVADLPEDGRAGRT